MKRIISFILIAVTVFAILIPATAANLTDVESNWAKPYIEQLIQLGAIKGKPDGLFHPNDTITRAEFTKVLLIAMGEDPGQPSNGYWGEYYISTARNKGLIKAGEFIDPEFNISRMEIAWMVVRALGKETEAMARVGKNTGFIDDASISDKYKGYVKVCKAYGIVNGYTDGTFRPNSYATRAEATKMIVTYLNNKNNTIDWTQVDKPVTIQTGDVVIDSIVQQIPGFIVDPYNAVKATKITLYNNTARHYQFSVSRNTDGSGTGTIQMFETTPENLQDLQIILRAFVPNKYMEIYNMAVADTDTGKDINSYKLGNGLSVDIGYINAFNYETDGVMIIIHN